MLGFSLQKLIVLGLIVAAVWYGFKWIGRQQRLKEGERKPAERSFGERLRKSMREKTGTADPHVVEETEKCPVCSAYVPVGGSDCGKQDCPY